jgi:hypothetical protein
VYKANSSATLGRYEQEIERSRVCLEHRRMSLVTGGSCLSCARGIRSGCPGRTTTRSRADSGTRSGHRESKTTYSRNPSSPSVTRRTGCRINGIGIAAFIFVLLEATFAHADVEDQETANANEPARFRSLVAAGDKARQASRNADAFRAYTKALQIHDDVSVEGRLGLVALALGEHTTAAEYLLRAITRSQAPAPLMQQFHAGFARVRPKVCFAEVFVSEAAAKFEIDGEAEPDSQQNSFHLFITPGPHTFRAKLAGFEDATVSVDAPAGGELEVKLDLKPLPTPPPVQMAPTSNWGPDPSLRDKPTNVGKPAKRLSDSYLHFYVGAGPVLVLGATPGVALGPQTIIGFRRGFFSLNLDARVAWATEHPERVADLQLMTWAFALRPCAHHRFVLGCGVIQVDGLEGLSENLASQATFGGGVRGGVELVVRKPLRLQLWGEALVHNNRHEVVQDGAVVWRGWPVTGAFGVTTLLTW